MKKKSNAGKRKSFKYHHSSDSPPKFIDGAVLMGLMGLNYRGAKSCVSTTSLQEAMLGLEFATTQYVPTKG
jgi:hypothetical protein